MWYLAYELLLLGGLRHVADVVEEVSQGLLCVLISPSGALLHTCRPLAWHQRTAEVRATHSKVHVILWQRWHQSTYSFSRQ